MLSLCVSYPRKGSLSIVSLRITTYLAATMNAAPATKDPTQDEWTVSSRVDDGPTQVTSFDFDTAVRLMHRLSAAPPLREENLVETIKADLRRSHPEWLSSEEEEKEEDTHPLLAARKQARQEERRLPVNICSYSDTSGGTMDRNSRNDNHPTDEGLPRARRPRNAALRPCLQRRFWRDLAKRIFDCVPINFILRVTRVVYRPQRTA
mgnify:CR=1 FL=1